jgi:hypothetical protein
VLSDVREAVEDWPRMHDRVQVVLDDLEARQQKAAVCCPAVERYVKQQVKYADVIDPIHPGIWFGPPTEDATPA